MSKEEIWQWAIEQNGGHRDEATIQDAMDEYAKQEAIEFDRWKFENGWSYDNDSGYYWKGTLPFLFEELYNLYLQSKKQKSK